MSSLLSDGFRWLGRYTGWSNTRAAWHERLGLLGWLSAAFLLYFFGNWLPEPLQVLAAALLVGLGAYIFRQGWLRLFGPVFFYDAIRLGRQRRQIWIRAAYATLLGVLLAWIYGLWYYQDLGASGHRVTIKESAQIATTYFEVFIIVQAILIALLTPAYVAGAIADEKERKTLEFLLATDLRNREIVFGKLASRVGTLALFILAGLPVLSFIQFFGGVDPERLLAAFAATLAGMLSLSAVSIFASVTAKRSRDAIALAYLIPFAYFAVSLLAQALHGNPDMNVPITVFGYTFTGMDIVYALTCGNPLIGLIELGRARGFRGPTPGGLLFQLLADFLTFHGFVLVACLAFAVWRVRAVALRQSYGGVPRSRSRQARRRPQVGEEPMIWKEVFVDAGLRFGLAGKIAILLILVLSFVPPIIMFWNAFIEREGFSADGSWWSPKLWDRLGDEMQQWLRVAGTVASCLMLLAVAIRGAGTIRGEQDRETLDSLLTTTLSSTRILWGKWWGCVLGVRQAWIWLGMMWLLALACGAVHLVAVPLYLLGMAIYVSAFAWLGIYCSLVFRSTSRATMAAIIASLFAGGGFILVFSIFCITPLTMVTDTRARDLEVLVEIQCGLSPAAVISWLPLRTFDRSEMEYLDRGHPFAVFAVIGLLVWCGLSLWLSRKARERFLRLANRQPYRRPATHALAGGER